MNRSYVNSNLSWKIRIIMNCIKTWPGQTLISHLMRNIIVPLPATPHNFLYFPIEKSQPDSYNGFIKATWI